MYHDYKGISRILLFGVSLFFGLIFHISFLGVIALWYAIIYSLEKITGYTYSLKFETLLLLFIVLSSYLGTSLGFYDRYWWWDRMLHFLYGFGFAFIGYKIILTAFKRKGVGNQLFIILAFSFCFAVSFGALWEICEYFFDRIGLFYFGRGWYPLVQTNPTLGSDAITDTMSDMTIETISALLLNMMIYCYYRFGIFSFINSFELTLKEKRQRITKKIQKSLDTNALVQKMKKKVEKITR